MESLSKRRRRCLKESKVVRLMFHNYFNVGAALHDDIRAHLSSSWMRIGSIYQQVHWDIAADEITLAFSDAWSYMLCRKAEIKFQHTTKVIQLTSAYPRLRQPCYFASPPCFHCKYSKCKPMHHLYGSEIHQERKSSFWYVSLITLSILAMQIQILAVEEFLDANANSHRHVAPQEIHGESWEIVERRKCWLNVICIS